MLMEVVRNRYGETMSMLAVTNVTANIRFAAGAGAEFGLGRRENYETNLTPLSGEIAYEESPTISYAPTFILRRKKKNAACSDEPAGECHKIYARARDRYRLCLSTGWCGSDHL